MSLLVVIGKLVGMAVWLRSNVPPPVGLLEMSVIYLPGGGGGSG